MKPDLTPLLGKTVTVTVDRPLGSRHPRYPDTVYPVNYGYLPDLLGGDGAGQDVYILGVDRPLDRFCGEVIAVIRRDDDHEDKLIAAPSGTRRTLAELEEAVEFTERYFVHSIIIQGESS